MNLSLRLLFFLFALLGHLAASALADSLSELELERSSDLQTWQSVPVTSAMINASGKLEVPMLGATEFYRMRIRAVEPTPVPANFALIPAGAFTMGDSLDGVGDAPARTVTLDAFYMEKYEVTKAKWDDVRTWALSNGYSDLAEGAGKASNHPVQRVSWYDIAKWCNSRSQKEGLTPVYYTDDAQTAIYKTGNVDVANTQVKWSANGYRLPTEAEWEKAARGGLSGNRFSWGDRISHSYANYCAATGFSYDDSAGSGYHPSSTGIAPWTSPVGAFSANGYGIYDVAGNVWEWCWDWYGPYSAWNAPPYSAESQINPRGITSGMYRVLRGGSWTNEAAAARVAVRHKFYSVFSFDYLGFRVARSSVQ